MVMVMEIIVWPMMMTGNMILQVKKSQRLLRLMKGRKISWLPPSLSTNLVLRMRISSQLLTKWSMKILRRTKILVT